MLEDVPHARQWLLRIAHNKELLFIDLSTHLALYSARQNIHLGQIIGYQRIEIVQRIRDEIAFNLDIDLEVFLEKLCKERLVPTPWLNKVLGIYGP